jgi:hypothetical protein
MWRSFVKKGVYLIPFLYFFPVLAIANDYPTLERVEQVLTCMKKHGGQTVDTLYSCSCEIDVIASQMAFDDFVEASTFETYKAMPGEAGAMFRDSKRGEGLTAKLQKAKQDAGKRCFLSPRKQKPE